MRCGDRILILVRNSRGLFSFVRGAVTTTNLALGRSSHDGYPCPGAGKSRLSSLTSCPVVTIVTLVLVRSSDDCSPGPRAEQ
eukprot:gene12255-biopygen3032